MLRPTPPIFGRMKLMYSEKLTKHERLLGLAKKNAEKNGVKLSAKITKFKNPREYIVKLAKEQKFDWIVMGSREWD